MTLDCCPVCGCRLATFTEVDEVACMECGWTERDER